MLDESVNQIGSIQEELYERLKELREIGGNDDYTNGLLKIIHKAGKEGVKLADVREIFGDAAKLKDAKDFLVEKKLITAEEQKNTLILKVAA